jgi:predicted phage baseplate assembly protein
MPLTAPNLDDRQFADIVAQAKTLIPRYVPEWTNFNESDPGITLVELFAWMTEMIIYRLNQVPDRNYIKFLQLIGIELEPAQPAHAEVTFSVARPDLSSAIVPAGTQISASGSSGQSVIFQIDEALIVIGAALAQIQTFDGTAYATQTNKNNTAGQWFYPFGSTPQLGNAMLLGFSSPVAFPAGVQINLGVSIYQSGLNQPVLQSGTNLPPPATVVWEYWNGTQWATVNLTSDGTRAFSQDGHILFTAPSNAAIGPIGNFTTTPYLYWFRARLTAATYEMPPQLNYVLTNTIGATQAITYTGEVLGGSDGTPNQTFQVANTPVVVLQTPLQVTNSDGTTVTVISVQLTIDEGQGFMTWQEVEDFYPYGPNDQVFVIDHNTGEIFLGSGDHGRIPVANAANPTGNVVAQSYMSGGGTQGNVAAGMITQLQTSVPSISSVTNYMPATGGTDEETVADAELRAGMALQSNSRAVTVQDYEYMATQAPGANVARALALPLYRPDFPNGQVPGAVTVIVVPNAPVLAPTPNQTTLQAVCQYLDANRLLTAELFVVGPVYRVIQVQVQIVVSAGSDLATVQNAIESALTTFFDPLQGGTDGTGWPFGGTIYYSDVYRVILNVAGVQMIQDGELLILLDGQQQTFCRDVAINPGELLSNDPNGHIVNVSYQSSTS